MHNGFILPKYSKYALASKFRKKWQKIIACLLDNFFSNACIFRQSNPLSKNLKNIPSSIKTLGGDKIQS